MEGSRPTLAIVTSSVDQSRWQNPAKAVGHLAEHDLGYRGIEFDITRNDYRLRPGHDPLMTIARSRESNTLAAIITTPWEGDAFAGEVAAIRTTAKRADIPTFVIGRISGEAMTDLGDNTYRASANSITLFESLRDLGSAVPPTDVQEPNTAHAEMQHLRSLENRKAVETTISEILYTSDEFLTRFGFAIDSELLANAWKRGSSHHFDAVHNLENILDIAANARTKRLAKQGILYKAPPRDIMFGTWWNTIEGYQSPIVRFSTYGHKDATVRRTAQYILDEKHAIPVDMDLYPLLDP